MTIKRGDVWLADLNPIRQELDARATAFQEEIEKRLASGPATPMDFPAVKRRIREEVEARQGQARLKD